MFFSENKNEVLRLTGNTNDLLTVSNDDMLKMTRLVTIKNENEENEEIISLDFVSSSKNMKHDFFDKFVGKDIEMVIRVI